MKIKRHLYNREKGTTKEVIENAELVKRNARTAWVRLSNGNIINRKNRDIVTEG